MGGARTTSGQDTGSEAAGVVPGRRGREGAVATSESSPSEETLRQHSLGGGGRLFFTKYTKRHIPINKNVFKRMHFLPQI